MLITIDYGYQQEGSIHSYDFQVSQEHADVIKDLCQRWEYQDAKEKVRKNI